MRKSSTESQGQVPEPSPRDIRLVALQNAIPFVGFGIMDNSILIIAGDAIDTSLGVALGISTMCAAAIGNIISDVAGVMLGTVIEDFCAGLGLPIPQLSAAQRQLRSVRFANQLGCAVGLVIGCIIGMFPLLLIDSNKISRLKQEAQMNAIFSDVVDQARELIGAEATNLYIIVDSKESKTPADPSKKLPAGSQLYFYSKHGHSIHIPIGRGAVSRVARTGKVANIKE
jgi:tRNA-specific adenosine deaminase 1